MRFSLAYNEDGSILTMPIAGEDASRLPCTRDTSDLFDTTNQVCDAELNEAMEGLENDPEATQLIQGNTRQEAHYGQI